MLFDISPFRIPLPDGVQVFASGANQLPEIYGFNRLGIPIGVSVNHLSEAAITALIDLRHPVMIDSGAFSEVGWTGAVLETVAPISDQEWRRRLDIYLQLAFALGEKATLVAPDRVGDQQETLSRLARYRVELEAIAEFGSKLLLPLQVGALSHIGFFEAARLAAGVALTPAMPMRKAATSVADLLSFVIEFKPPHMHLLGMGINNRSASKLIQAIKHFSPGTSISMDSNRLRAVVGDTRPLTRLEAELRAAETEKVYGNVDSPVLALNGETLDYTDWIASPSLWSTHQQLMNIAEAVGLTVIERKAFAYDPNNFLQSPFRESGALAWIEHPLMSLELDRAWEEYVEARIRLGVRTAAIVSVFADSRISGQTHRGQ
jgi:hypothetical protein